MKHTLKTVGVLVVIIAIAVLLLLAASVLNTWSNFLLSVNIISWIFFLAGIAVALISSTITTALSNHFSKKREEKNSDDNSQNHSYDVEDEELYN